MKYDLFISHSSADAETAQALVADFENRNIACWMAPRDIPMGSSYHEEIVQAIENSRAVLLLFSNAANKSEHVLREVEIECLPRNHAFGRSCRARNFRNQFHAKRRGKPFIFGHGLKGHRL